MAEIQGLDDKLKEVLNKVGVRYSEDKVKWAITSDKAGLTPAINIDSGSKALLRSSHIIFLEQGNDKAGLDHIFMRHVKDFKNKCGVGNKKDISSYIEKAIKAHAPPIKVRPGKRGGLDVVYKINDNNYLHMTIGSNGFIVTAFPSSKP